MPGTALGRQGLHALADDRRKAKRGSHLAASFHMGKAHAGRAPHLRKREGCKSPAVGAGLARHGARPTRPARTGQMTDGKRKEAVTTASFRMGKAACGASPASTETRRLQEPTRRCRACPARRSAGKACTPRADDRRKAEKGGHLAAFFHPGQAACGARPASTEMRRLQEPTVGAGLARHCRNPPVGAGLARHGARPARLHAGKPRICRASQCVSTTATDGAVAEAWPQPPSALYTATTLTLTPASASASASSAANWLRCASSSARKSAEPSR